MNTNLIFLNGEREGESFELTSEDFSIGRETDNDISLSDALISRHHARITFQDGNWILKDLESSHGSLVNDAPIEPDGKVLQPGDLIQIGDHRLKFESGVADVTMAAIPQADPTPPEPEPAPAEEETTPPQEEAPAEEAPAEAAPPADEEKGSKKKIFLGCGGCGCLIALLALGGGGFMLAMWEDSHMSELGPFGAIVTPIAVVIGIVALVFLILGFTAKK